MRPWWVDGLCCAAHNELPMVTHGHTNLASVVYLHCQPRIYEGSDV